MLEKAGEGRKQLEINHSSHITPGRTQLHQIPFQPVLVDSVNTVDGGACKCVLGRRLERLRGVDE